MHEKDLLAEKLFIPLLESVLSDICKQRKQLAEQYGKDGLSISGPHSRAIIDLELSHIKKLLDSKLDIDLNVYFRDKLANSKQDEFYLVGNVERLYELRKTVSVRSLDDYLKQRGFSNVEKQLARFEIDAEKILVDIKRKIEIIVLQNKISKPVFTPQPLPLMETDFIIEKGECQKIEFKSSLRWDLEKKCMNKDLQIEVLETICAFNNTDGGYLLIGVADNRSIYGIEMDYATFHDKKNPDTFIQTITNLIKAYVGNEFAAKLEILVEKRNEHDICKIKIDVGSEPIWLKKNNKEYFYIRTQAGEQELTPREASEYIRRKWPIYPSTMKSVDRID